MRQAFGEFHHMEGTAGRACQLARFVPDVDLPNLFIRADIIGYAERP